MATLTVVRKKIIFRKSLHSEHPDGDHVMGTKITCFLHLTFLLWFMLQVDNYARPSSKLRPVIMSEKLQEKLHSEFNIMHIFYKIYVKIF